MYGLTVKRWIALPVLTICMSLSCVLEGYAEDSERCAEAPFRVDDNSGFAVFNPQSSAHLALYRALNGRGGVPSPISYRYQWAPASNLWHARLAELGIEETLPTASSPYQPERFCRYSRALVRLDERVRQLGRAHPYVKAWALNQSIVFLNCETKETEVRLPKLPMPEDPGLSAMVEADFDYQLASAYYYAGEWAKAIAAFEPISVDGSSPYQSVASYMLARSRFAAKDIDEAEALSEEMAQDPVFIEVRPAAQTLLDVIAYRSRNVDLLEDQLTRIDALLDRPVEEIVDDDELVERYDQAQADLAWFLRGISSKLPVDWWLRDEVISDDARAEATRRVAHRSDLIDWLQTMQQSNWFTSYSWLALDWAAVRSDAYDRVSRHAVERWRQTGARAWEIAAFERAKPGDEATADLLQSFEVVRQRLKSCTMEFGDRLVYPILLYHAMRLKLTGGDLDGAAALLDEGKSHYNSLFYRVYLDGLRWLIGTGQIEEARRWDSHSLWKGDWRRGDGLPQLRQIIASDMEGFLDALSRGSANAGTAAAFNLLPLDQLMPLLDSDRLSPKDRAALARMAWTRAYLLGRTPLLEALTFKLRLLNPELDSSFDLVDAARRESDRDHLLTYILLATPRLGIRFNAPDAFGARGSYESDLRTLDRQNPNDNNWWCRFDPARAADALARDFYDAAVLRAPFGRRDNNIFTDADWAAYRQIRDHVLSQHPVLALVDQGELTELAAVENAPLFLGRRAVAWADETSWIDRWLGRDRLLPKTLHLAVRATRYGCRREGVYGAVSRPAFEALQSRYPGSEWAKLTPFWYDQPPGASR